MIEVTIDKESEILWLDSILRSGILNAQNSNMFKFFNIPVSQEIIYIKSEEYVDDIKDKREEFNKRFEGLTPQEINKILEKEFKDKQ